MSIFKKLLVTITLLSFIPAFSADPKQQKFQPTHYEEVPVLIIGSGMGALTSALYLARGSVPHVVISGPIKGGAIIQSHGVKNWPGEIEITGDALIEKMNLQAEANKVVIKEEKVIAVDFSKRPYLVTTQSFFNPSEIKQYSTQACIIGLGAGPKLLGIPGEEAYFSKGVYSCAVCDGGLFRNKTVAVVGGGDSAIGEVLYLSNIAKKVHLFIRGDTLKTGRIERSEKALALPNVEVHFYTVITEVEGDGQKVTSLQIENRRNGQKERLPIDALFLAIGSTPQTEMFKEQIELDSQGYITLKNYQETSLPGIYAIGDISDPEFKQAVTAAGDGAKAAIQAKASLKTMQPALTTAQEVEKKSLSTKKPEVIEVHSKKALQEILTTSEGPVLVDFYASYCGPCKMFAPLYEKWAKEHGTKITFVKVNAEKAHDLFAFYHIQAVPTLLILDKKGKETHRYVGMQEIGQVETRLKQLAL